MKLKPNIAFAAYSLLATALFAVFVLWNGTPRSLQIAPVSPVKAQPAVWPGRQGGDTVQTCKLDGGKTWYFSIGREVFKESAIDYQNRYPLASTLVSNIDEKSALLPPDPSSPIGCLGNPQQLAEYTAGEWPRLELNDYSGDMPKIAEVIEMFRYPHLDDEPPSLDPILEENLGYWSECQSRKFLKRFDDGSFLCATKKEKLNIKIPRDEDMLWEYIISGNLYRTPMGDMLVANEILYRIHVYYRLYSDIILNYQYDIPQNSSIDTKYIISVDKLIESKLDSYRVINYPWPQQPASQPASRMNGYGNVRVSIHFCTCNGF